MHNPSKQRAYLPLTERSVKTKARIEAIEVGFIPSPHPLELQQATRILEHYPKYPPKYRIPRANPIYVKGVLHTREQA